MSVDVSYTVFLLVILGLGILVAFPAFMGGHSCKERKITKLEVENENLKMELRLAKAGLDIKEESAQMDQRLLRISMDVLGKVSKKIEKNKSPWNNPAEGLPEEDALFIIRYFHTHSEDEGLREQVYEHIAGYIDDAGDLLYCNGDETGWKAEEVVVCWQPMDMLPEWVCEEGK